jgi:hypothetical protein
VTRALRLALFTSVVLLAVPAAAAHAATHMPVGFFDDPAFRWSPVRDQNLAAAAATGATVVHTTANWALIAPTKPANAADPNDPAYQLSDLDELVQKAGLYGMRVLIDITSTPKWANGNQTPNHAPKSVSTLQTFARMLATRYNGKPGSKGSVSMYAIWNEPNLEQFLTPQYTGTKITSPALYARMFKAAYAGIKAGNKLAKVAIGETSAQGRDKLAKGNASQTVSPGMFAKLLAKQKGLKFDAWAHHPYPTSQSAKPLEKVRYPNVTLSTLPTFEKDLKAEFHRVVPIWITEYGHETKPGEPKGVTPAVQAAYAKQALTVARNDQNVQMFVWFTFRDSAGNPWQSGLELASGAHKPSYAAFSSLARLIDGTTQTVKAGVSPKVTVYVPFLSYYSAPGSVLGMTYRIYEGAKLLAVGQPTAKLAVDQSVVFTDAFKPVKGHTYTVTAVLNEPNGHSQTRTVTLIS